MTRIRWTKAAVRDLESIHEFISRDSEQYAGIQVRRVLRAVDRLAVFPRAGRIVPEVDDPDLREVIVAPFRIVYLVSGERVVVLSIFHAARLFSDEAG